MAIAYKLRRIDGAEPVYKPAEPEVLSTPPLEETVPDSYEKTPSAVDITDAVIYDQGKIIIDRASLESADLQERAYDSELQYAFDLLFIEDQYAEVQIDDALVKNISLGANELIINCQRISAFNVSSDTQYVYIEYIAPKDKYDKIVFLDPGHGGADHGAVVDGVMEKDLNFTLALRVFKLFQADDANDVKVYMTRQSDAFLTPMDRMGMAEGVCDFFVSIHHNVYEFGANVYGTETYYQDREEATSPSGLTSNDVASIIHGNLVEQIQFHDRGVMFNKAYYILNHATIPTTLTEIGFMTNPEELAKLQDDEYVELAAIGIYNGIKEICSQWSFR